MGKSAPGALDRRILERKFGREVTTVTSDAGIDEQTRERCQWMTTESRKLFQTRTVQVAIADPAI